MAQTLEKIVRCPVLLDDHDDMLETRDLRLSDQRPGKKQHQTSKNEFHPVSGPRFAKDFITLSFVVFRLLSGLAERRIGASGRGEP